MIDLGKSDVLVDLCTQRDYLLPEGARVAANAPQMLPNFKRLMAYARWAKLPTLSCIDVRRPDEARGARNAACVLGAPGQQKLCAALLPNRVMIECDNCLCVALDVLKAYQQAIFTKCHRDPFTNPKLDRLLTEMPARRFIVCGVALEESVRLLTLGLLLRERKVALVRDACGHWNAGEADMALRQMAAKGCEVLSADEYIRAGLTTRPLLAPLRPRGKRDVA